MSRPKAATGAPNAVAGKVLAEIAGGAVAAMLLILTCGTAAACELPVDAKDSGRIDAPDGTSIAWRTDPDPLRVDSHFALEIRACAREAITAIAVDAQMPEHRHGMNYKPTLTRSGAEGWRAEGLLFHMPGKWEITFVVTTAQGAQRYLHAMLLR